jgi:hypothetical protein
LKRWYCLAFLGIFAASFCACGPDHKPEQPCDGPNFNLVVTAENGVPLPADTRINVRYGGNQEGEPYTLGATTTPQAVFCVEDASMGGAPANGDNERAAGAAGTPPEPEPEPEPAPPQSIVGLRCRLYTQGPARLDVTASGFEPIDDHALSLERKKRCEVPIDITLAPLKPDAGT